MAYLPSLGKDSFFASAVAGKTVIFPNSRKLRLHIAHWISLD
jgi:hypothetical protein